MQLQTYLSALAVFGELAAANLQFRSRPEFAVPRLNITKRGPAESLEKGFIFVTPYEGGLFTPDARGPVQPGAYIYRDDGELVWSGNSYLGGWPANFVPVVWRGKPHLRVFQGVQTLSPDGHPTGRMFGHHLLLDDSYRTVKTVTAGSHKWASAHEFELVNEKTALIEVPVPVYSSLKPWGGSKDQNWVLSSGFQEVDIETNEVVFEWYSFDHIDPKTTALPLVSTNPGVGTSESNVWDYFHLNSVDKDDEGNYLISARNTATIYKINATDGATIWQLGGFHGTSDFEFDNAVDKFGYQHDARFLGRSDDGTKEYVSVFDNGAHSPTVKTHPFSRAHIYELDHTTGKARALHTYNAPDRLSAGSQGNARLQPNGNVFVNWGQAGAVTEFSRDGEVLFHAYLDSEPQGNLVQSYRGFRANWTGIPAEEPALVVLPSESSHRGVDVYVSWNGDTETEAWRFYAVSGRAQKTGRLLGEVKRSGFETRASFISLSVSDVHIYAEAVDGKKGTLARTTPVTVASYPWYQTDYLSEQQVVGEL